MCSTTSTRSDVIQIREAVSKDTLQRVPLIIDRQRCGPTSRTGHPDGQLPTQVPGLVHDDHGCEAEKGKVRHWTAVGKSGVSLRRAELEARALPRCASADASDLAGRGPRTSLLISVCIALVGAVEGTPANYAESAIVQTSTLAPRPRTSRGPMYRTPLPPSASRSRVSPLRNSWWPLPLVMA